MSFESKNIVRRKAFLIKQSINVIYPNEEIEFMAPNHGKEGDYYENLHLSHC